jgi:hypothetical protein
MKWFKHDSDANQDTKIQNVLLDYGLEGYGLYFYCIELIVGKLDNDHLTFELENDARVIARNTGSTVQRVEEMMRYFIKIELFESSDGVITCMALAKRLDKSMTSNPQMRKMIANIKSHDYSPDNHDSIMTKSDSIMLDKTRIDKSRITDLSGETPNQPIKPKPKSKAVPYEKIWEAYTNILTNDDDYSLIKMVTLTPERKTRMKQCWEHKLINRDIGSLTRYFQWLYDGRENHSWLFGHGNRSWKGDIEYICRIKTIAKAREGSLGNWER